MNKIVILSEMAKDLCERDESEVKKITIAQASRMCKVVCISVADKGWKKTKRELLTLFFNDPKLKKLSVGILKRQARIFEEWFKSYNYFLFSPVKSEYKKLIESYKK